MAKQPAGFVTPHPLAVHLKAPAVTLAAELALNPRRINLRIDVGVAPQTIELELLVYPRGPWSRIEDVELATLEWVWWFNNHRLFGPLGHVPPAEYEEQYRSRQSAQSEPLSLKSISLR